MEEQKKIKNRESYREYYAKNREKKIARSKEAYYKLKETNPELWKERQKIYNARRLEKVKNDPELKEQMRIKHLETLKRYRKKKQLERQKAKAEADQLKQ